MVNTDNGPIDKLALRSINDIEEYWQAVYKDSLKGSYNPPSKLVSYDSTDRSSPTVCHNQTYKLVNAFFTLSATVQALSFYWGFRSGEERRPVPRRWDLLLPRWLLIAVLVGIVVFLYLIPH